MMRQGLVVAALLLPGFAAAQSSNSSSNCSNGRCTVIERYRPEGAPPWMTWQRTQTWREGERGWQPPWPGAWNPHWGHPGYRLPRQGWPQPRHDDDDDD